MPAAMKLRLLPEHLHIGRGPYAFLLYLAFVFIAPVIRKTPADWAIAFGSLAIFLPMYFRNFWVQGTQAVLMCTGMALVGFVVFPRQSTRLARAIAWTRRVSRGQRAGCKIIAWPPGRGPIIVSAFYAESPASLDDRSAVLADVARIVARSR